MYKKKIFGSIAVLAIAAMAAFNVNINTQEECLSDILLENVEALAAIECNRLTLLCYIDSSGACAKVNGNIVSGSYAGHRCN